MANQPSKSYKEMTISELCGEQARLKYIITHHPKPFTYKQTKKALERINRLITNYTVNSLGK